MNNQVGDMFQCWTCRGLFDSMWGETCNSCREAERRHKELICAITNKL